MMIISSSTCRRLDAGIIITSSTISTSLSIAIGDAGSPAEAGVQEPSNPLAIAAKSLACAEAGNDAGTVSSVTGVAGVALRDPFSLRFLAVICGAGLFLEGSPDARPHSQSGC